MLETLEHAQARGATILGEVVGYGMTCDAHHITSPTPGGVGGAEAMRLALADGGIDPRDRLRQRPRHQHPGERQKRNSAIKSALGERPCKFR